LAFENLAEKLSLVFKRLGSKGKLIEDDIKIAMREIRLALLEADVNYSVVKNLISKISERALGVEIMKSLTPAQMVVKVVKEELVSLLGGTSSIKLDMKVNVIMLCGLQGTGKTTHAAKLAVFLKNKSYKPMIAACDIYRPAAVRQLEILGKNAGIKVFFQENSNPIEIAKGAMNEALNNYDVLILDTAGRLHIDEVLMTELKEIKNAINPSEILLVVDAMTGQDAVNIAKSFNDLLKITGVILTKFDGDARGGAALSVKAITGSPIKFIGTGEKLGDIEPFKPDRVVSRILGMGDILTLIENAQESFDKENVERLAQKFNRNKFDLEDFLLVLNQIKKMGPLKSIMSCLPIMDKIPGVRNLNDVNFDDKIVTKIESVILSMTFAERAHPEIIDFSRKKRISKGSGSKLEDINNLLKRFGEMKKMMKQFDNKGGLFGMNKFNFLSKFKKR